MTPAAPSTGDRWDVSRLGATVRHYGRRASRWGRVLGEYRPGVVRPGPGLRRVLVVRLDAIGDFVLWSGAAKALRAWLGPETHVTLVANALWADLASDPGIADDVWPVQRELLEWDAGYRAALRARAAGGGFAMAINPQHTREMMFGDSVVRWSRARVRIGSVGEGQLLPPQERFWADRWYTRLLPASAGWMHESERHAEFLRSLGVSVPRVPAPSLTVIRHPSAELDHLAEGYFVVFPGASLPGRQWGTRGFAEAARYIQQRTGWRPVLLGNATDAPATREIARELPGAIDLAGRTSVPVFASAVQGARLLLTNETSSVHIAAATGVPSVCITGGGHWQRFVPYPASLAPATDLVQAVSMEKEMSCFKCNWRCVLPHVAGQPLPCVSRVPVDRVIAAVDRVLSQVMVTEPNG